jgi:putative Mg2+ transporter-C (MgtC) family protein
MGPELAVEEAVGRLLLVVVLAGAVGIERELRDQEAGLRTHMLVGVGAALFVIVGNFAWGELAFGNEEGVVLDPSRVVAYVVTGVGFLGAGTILKNGATVRGLTTAASLWVVAAIGVTVGAGMYVLGLIATGIVLLSLWPVKWAAGYLGLRRRRSNRLQVELAESASVADVIRAIEEAGAEIASTKLVVERDGRRLDVVLSGRRTEVADLLDRLPSTVQVRSLSTST